MKTNRNVWRAIAAAFFAILTTLALYFTEAFPFSLLETEATKTEAAQSPAMSGEQLRIVVPEAFDQTTKGDAQTRVSEDGTDTWTKTVTLINLSDKALPVYLFIQGQLAACTDADPKNNCVEFDPAITIPPGESQTVTIEFTKIALPDNKPVEGKLILAGGDVQREIPFSIMGEWPKTPIDLAAVGRWIVIGLLGLLILCILYLILYSRILPFLRRESSIPFMLDVNEENKKFWPIFSNRLREMQEQGYGQNLVTPRTKGEAIDLPTNLGKEGDIFKAVIDLLNWILPRRGVTIRLQPIENQAKGKDFSVALVQNSDNQILTERLFRASDYSLSAQTANVESILMTPIILWLSNWKEKNKGGKTNWEVQAYCELATILWPSNSDSGKNLYTTALLKEPANRQAQAGLGRIWLEDCSREDNMPHEKEDCLNFAIAYLNEACERENEDLPDSSAPHSGKEHKREEDLLWDNPLWFSSRYNLAVASLYQGAAKTSASNNNRDEPALQKAYDLCKELLEEIKRVLSLPKRRRGRRTRLERENENDFIDWLRRFWSMVKVFEQSARLEANHPGTANGLEEEIQEAIENFKKIDKEWETLLHQVPTEEAESNEMLTTQRNSPAQGLPSSRQPLTSQECLVVTLDYRSQYNAACYFSRCYRLSKEFNSAKLNKQDVKQPDNPYTATALDYLRLALAHGGGLAESARKDPALKPLRDDFREEFDDIAPKKETPDEKEDEAVLHLAIDKPVVIKYEKSN